MSSRTPKYRIEITKSENLNMDGIITYDGHFGQANANGLTAMVNAINASFELGGVNFIAGKPVARIVEAKLVKQAGSVIVASYPAELFTAV